MNIYIRMYIYIYINHIPSRINFHEYENSFSKRKKKKREEGDRRVEKEKEEGEKEEFRKLGNGEGNRLRWHAVPLREDGGGRGRISGRNLRPRL